MLGKNLITAAAGNAGGEVLGIEDVFSTWLYTGTGSTQTITNGIDLAGEGGLVWIKQRNGTYSHVLTDTERGVGQVLATNSASGSSGTYGISAFSSGGFSVDSTVTFNSSSNTFASWTFRKAEKFFDVVTYTGDGVAGRTISHSLGSTPGFIVVKATSTTGAWYCLHTGGGTPRRGQLNSDAAFSTSNLQFYWGDGTNYVVPTASDFTVYSSNDVNGLGITYVAYLFAHDAGGFGDDGTESVIKCGSFTPDGSGNATVTLGWEPQWLLVKRATTSGGSWYLLDSMRGIPTGGNDAALLAEAANAEASSFDLCNLTPTGFQIANQLASATYIYIAIRRGPMKTPTDATEVFSALNAAGTNAATTITTGFTTDLFIRKASNGAYIPYWLDRFRNNAYLDSSATSAESTGATAFASGLFASNTGFAIATGATAVNSSSFNYSTYAFRRAPGFFDVVAYTGTGANRTVNHNLGVVPELMIVKIRNDSYQWVVNSQSIAADSILVLNGTSAELTSNSTVFNGTRPTASVFSVGTAVTSNGSAKTYIAYLFATCPGVSKVGSYTGTGTTLQVDCGFASGARFVLIKRTDSTGDWYVWDTARGIVSGNDPYLLLNSTAAEVTNTDYIDPYSAGFQISSTAPAAINASGGSYIFLAIA